MCRSGAIGSVFPAGFGSNFRIMVGSALGPGSTFKAFLGSARVRVPLSNKIRVRVGSVQHIYGSFGPVKTSIVNSDLALPVAVFSLCVRVLLLCPVLTSVYRLSNITTQITVWEIIVIQFVCSSEKADRVFGAKTIRF